MRNRVALASLCLVAWIAAMMESASRREAGPGSGPTPPVAPPVQNEAPAVTSRLSVGSPAASVHSATAVELPDGTIRAYWFGGSREGASDVAKWTAELVGGGWSPPRVAVDRDLVARGTRRYLRKLGNPVAHVGEDGRVTLYVVSVSLGGWSGSAINRLVFAPDGKRVEPPPTPGLRRDGSRGDEKAIS